MSGDRSAQGVPVTARYLERGNVFAGVIIAAIAVLYFWYVHAFAINVPIKDEWNLIPFVEQAYRGRFNLSLLWSQYLENRMVVARLMELVSAKFLRFNVKDEMYGGALLLVAEFLLIAACVRTAKIRSVWLLLPVATLVFTWTQYENSLWGLCFTNFLTVFCCVAALTALALSKNAWWGIALAVAAAIIGTLSTVEGFAIWPGCAVILWNASGSGRKRAAWIASCLVFGLVYAHGYQFGGGSVGTEPLFDIFLHPVGTVAFYTAMAGVPLSLFALYPPHAPTVAFGALVVLAGILLVAYWFFRDRENLLLQRGCALIAFTLTYAAMTTLGRAPFGVGLAFVSRYTTYMILLWVGVYMGAIALAPKIRRRAPKIFRAAYAAGAAVLLLQAVLAFGYGYGWGVTTRNQEVEARTLLVNIRNEPLSALHHALFNNTGDFRSEASFLEGEHLSVWS